LVDKPFRTISAAAAIAGPGDTVFVSPGVYREHIAPVRGGTKDAPVTYEAAPGHQVFVRGSEEWRPAWTQLPDHPGVFSAPLDKELFVGAVRNPYLTTIGTGDDTLNLPARPATALAAQAADWLKDKQLGRLPRTLGQLFVDGQPLLEAEVIAEVHRTPGSWIVNEQGDGIIAHFPPSAKPLSERLVELTVRDRIFAPARRNLSYIVVRGFVFEHAANQGPFPQLGAVSVRSGKNWLIEGNIVRYAKTIGIDAGSESWMVKSLLLTEEEDKRLIIGGGNVVRGNSITDNGLCGLAAWHCAGIVVENNLVARNNALGFRPTRTDYNFRWEEHAGIKLHGATGGRIEGNFVIDNDAPGIWIDNGFTRARITRNVVLNNAGSGIMLELGNGPALVDNNVVAFTRPYNDFYAGDGIYGHDSSNVTIAHNLFFANARHGVFFQLLGDREYDGKLTEASGLRVLNNLLFDNVVSAVNLPLEGERTKDNRSENNVISARKARFITNEGPTTGSGAVRIREILTAEDAYANSGKDYGKWSINDGLSIEEWRRVTGWDKATVVENPQRMIIRPHTREIELQLGAKSLAPVPAVAFPQDIPGAPLPSGARVFAGPWQDLGALNNRFFLWPLPNF
jgi:hypothetical protein